MESVPPTSEHLDPANAVPFQAHVELLQFFLAHRDEIVERIQGLLNAQRKPVQYLRDRFLRVQSRLIEYK